MCRITIILRYLTLLREKTIGQSVLIRYIASDLIDFNQLMTQLLPAFGPHVTEPKSVCFFAVNIGCLQRCLARERFTVSFGTFFQNKFIYFCCTMFVIVPASYRRSHKCLNDFR